MYYHYFIRATILITFFKANTKKLLLVVSILCFFQPSSVSTLKVNTPTKHILSHITLLAATCVLPAALNEWEKASLNLQTKSMAETDTPTTQTFKEKMLTHLALAQTVGKNLLRPESYDHLKKLRAVFGPSKIDAETKSIEELEQFSPKQELIKYLSQNKLVAWLLIIELANVVRSSASVIQYALQPKIVDADAGAVPPPHVDPNAGAVPPPLHGEAVPPVVTVITQTTRDKEKARNAILNLFKKREMKRIQEESLEALSLTPEDEDFSYDPIESYETMNQPKTLEKNAIATKFQNLWRSKKARTELSTLKAERKQRTSAATKIAATWRGFFTRKDQLIFNQPHDVSDVISGNTQAPSAMDTHPEKDDMPAPAVSLETEAAGEAREIADRQREQQTTRAHSNWNTFVRKLSRAKSTAIIIHPTIVAQNEDTRPSLPLLGSGARSETYAASYAATHPNGTQLPTDSPVSEAHNRPTASTALVTFAAPAPVPAPVIETVTSRMALPPMATSTVAESPATIARASARLSKKKKRGIGVANRAAIAKPHEKTVLAPQALTDVDLAKEMYDYNAFTIGSIILSKDLNLSGSGNIEVIEVTADGFALAEKNAREIINLYKRNIRALAQIIGCDERDKTVNDTLAAIITNQIESMRQKRTAEARARNHAEAEAAKPWWKPRFSW